MPIMQYGVNADGGFLSVPVLSKKFRHAAQQRAVLRQFTTKESAFGTKMGNTFNFDRGTNISSAGSSIGIPETGAMPESKIPITQGSIVITEYGNSIRFTRKLVTLGTISISDVVETALMNDGVKTLDLAVRTIYRSTDVKVKYATTGTDAAPTSTFDTDGTQTTAWTRKLQVFDIKEVVDYLKGTLYAEPYTDDNYLFVGSVGAQRPIFDSSGFQDVAIRQEGGGRIWRGEVGTYYRCRVVDENHSFANTTGGYGGEFICQGKDGVMEAQALPLQIIVGEKKDFGRDNALAWYFVGGWNEVWDTSANATVVHGTSA